jgi:hypothetical protein
MWFPPPVGIVAERLDGVRGGRNICGLHLHAYADQLQPKISSLRSEIEQYKHHGLALHAHLHDRSIPVNDAAMLARSMHVRIMLILAVLAAIAFCLVTIQNAPETVRAQGRSALKMWLAALCQAPGLRLRFEG